MDIIQYYFLSKYMFSVKAVKRQDRRLCFKRRRLTDKSDKMIRLGSWGDGSSSPQDPSPGLRIPSHINGGVVGAVMCGYDPVLGKWIQASPWSSLASQSNLIGMCTPGQR